MITKFPIYTPIPHRPRIARIATNWFLLVRGNSWGFFLQSWCSTSQYRFRYDFVTNIRGNRLNSAGIAQEFNTICKITLDHAARKLRNQLRISYEYAECSTNWARVYRNPRRIATIREIFSHNSYKKRPIYASGASVPKWMFLVKQQ